MRTALVLLFLLAVASVPGSVLPQRGNNPLRVDQWLTNNATAGPANWRRSLRSLSAVAG